MRVRVLLILSLAVTASVAWQGGAPVGAEDPAPGDPAHATFEGEEINLTESWGEATACVVFDDHTECFSTEAEMLEAHPELSGGDLGSGHAISDQTASSAQSGFSIQAECSTSLRLYRLTGFGGQVLALTTRGVYLNLSTWGFDNDTSSYRVGTCGSIFRAGSSGSGSAYPGATGANAVSASMLSGWDNAVSSVYIN